MSMLLNPYSTRGAVHTKYKVNSSEDPDSAVFLVVLENDGPLPGIGPFVTLQSI